MEMSREELWERVVGLLVRSKSASIPSMDNQQYEKLELKETAKPKESPLDLAELKEFVLKQWINMDDRDEAISRCDEKLSQCLEFLKRERQWTEQMLTTEIGAVKQVQKLLEALEHSMSIQPEHHTSESTQHFYTHLQEQLEWFVTEHLPSSYLGLDSVVQQLLTKEAEDDPYVTIDSTHRQILLATNCVRQHPSNKKLLRLTPFYA